jgi:hypothetical protein
MKLNRVATAIAIVCLGTLPIFAAQEGSFDRTLKVTGTVELDVSTGSGGITISRGSEGQVVVHATIRASEMNWFSGGDPAARIKAIQDNPPIEQSGNVIRVGHFPDSERQRNVSITYDIQVPQDVRLHSRTGSGHIRISSINGPVDASTGSGGIEISEVAADARLQTGSGSIAINNVAGTVRAHTGSGSISGEKIGGASTVNTMAKFQGKALPLTSGSSTASGRSYLDFETGSGDIHVQNIAGELKAHTGSGSIEAQGQQTGDWDINTGSGGIRVRLPEASKFTLMARTSSGSVSTDFPLTIQGTVNKRELSGSVNGGGPRLELHTGSGSIHIEK